MSIDRKIFKSPFREKELTNWNCPTCGKGFLKIMEGTFHYEETRNSKRARSSGDWEPDWIEYLYSCLLECNNSTCREFVSSSGVGSTYQYMYDEKGMPYLDYRDHFSPKYFSPHLKIFDYHQDIPDEVKNELEISFSLFFCDPPSSANHIRIALEDLLTYMEIDKCDDKNGEPIYLSLHSRIKLLPKKYHDIQDIFMAVKWLGNAGSHRGTVSADDVLDAYELMQKLLAEVFNDEGEKIKKLANKINKQKGPTKSIFS